MTSISVIIPLYNKEPYIGRAVQSVLNQTYSNFELIVVDDGSTDDGPRIVNDFKDSRIRIVSQCNSGVSAARNRGVRESRADLIAFLDADDIWQDCFLNRIFELVDIFPKAGAYATAFAIDKGDGAVKEVVKKIHNVHTRQIGLLNFLKRQGLCSSSIVIRRAVFNTVGHFREGYKMAEDWDMFLRISIFFSIAYNKRICAIWFYSISDSATKINLPDFPSPPSAGM